MRCSKIHGRIKKSNIHLYPNAFNDAYLRQWNAYPFIEISIALKNYSLVGNCV